MAENNSTKLANATINVKIRTIVLLVLLIWYQT